MASIRQIAERAGVSIATVSRVMNNHPQVSETLRQKVKLAAEEGFHPRPSSDPASAQIGVLFTTERVTIGSPFDSAVMTGVSEEMGVDAVDLRVMTPAQLMRDGSTLVGALRRRGLDGVLVRTATDSNHHAVKLFEAGFPAVVINDRIEHPDASYLAGSSRQASREAVEHLLGIGHTKIALVNSRISDTDHLDRYAGYRDAMDAAGLGTDQQRVVRAWPNRQGGTVAMNQIAIERDRPTALFFADMAAAMGASKRALEMGLKIPDDLSIVGFDDTDLRFFAYPTMSAVCQDTHQIGRQALRMLSALMNEPGAPPQRAEAATWFEVHDSTAPVSSD
ncbi:MAG: LacI family DNA-binding transcriptional regulator [Planctomycetota bacterium]